MGPPVHDPGYVLHYLPYDNYQPVHPESLAHPAPVPHHPHAAHMLVPGTHVPPVPLLGVSPTPHLTHETPVLHPHSGLETVPVLQPHPEVSELQAHPAVPFPVTSFLPH